MPRSKEGRTFDEEIARSARFGRVCRALDAAKMEMQDLLPLLRSVHATFGMADPAPACGRGRATAEAMCRALLDLTGDKVAICWLTMLIRESRRKRKASAKFFFRMTPCNLRRRRRRFLRRRMPNHSRRSGHPRKRLRKKHFSASCLAT